MESQRLTLNLMRDDSDGTKVTVDVTVDIGGDLRMEGYDIGEAPRKWFDKDDYEYYVIVPSREKDRLLLHLLVEVFGQDDTPMSSFKSWLEERGIAHTMWTS